MREKMRKLSKEFTDSSTELYTKVMCKARGLDNKAQGSITAGAVIGLAIGLIVIAAVIPSAISAFYETNTSTWLIDGATDTKAVTLWWLLPFICVAAVLYMVYKRLD